MLCFYGFDCRIYNNKKWIISVNPYNIHKILYLSNDECNKFISSTINLNKNKINIKKYTIKSENKKKKNPDVYKLDIMGKLFTHTLINGVYVLIS